MNIASLELESDKNRIKEVKDCIARLSSELESMANALHFQEESQYRYVHL